MKIKVCKVAFPSGPQQYSYLCGALDPQPGQQVVVQTNDGKLKLVTCMNVIEEEPSTKFTYKHLFATLHLQPQEAQ